MSSPTASRSASHNSLVSTPAPCHSEWGWAILDGARSVLERILLCSWFGAVFDLLQHSCIKACGWDFLVLLLKQKIPVVQGEETFLHLVKDVTVEKVISAPFTFITLEKANPFVLCFSFLWGEDSSPSLVAQVPLDVPVLCPSFRTWSTCCCVISQCGDTSIKRMWGPSAAFLKILQLHVGKLYPQGEWPDGTISGEKWLPKISVSFLPALYICHSLQGRSLFARMNLLCPQ